MDRNAENSYGEVDPANRSCNPFTIASEACAWDPRVGTLRLGPDQRQPLRNPVREGLPTNRPVTSRFRIVRRFCANSPHEQ
jgi:hypothetical protein